MAKQPNVIVFFTDQQRWDTSGLHGNPLDLTPVEFRLLSIMQAHPGRVFSRDQLLNAIYDDHRIVTDRTIDSHIKNLRKKMQALSTDEDMIRSIYGVGYKLQI